MSKIGNPIGKKTVNVSVNLLEQERLTLGRLALADDRSMGDFIRRLMLTGLRTTNPQAAAEIEAARKAYLEKALSKIK